MTTFYITKHLFTSGIQTVDGCEVYVTAGREYVTRGNSSQGGHIFAHVGTEAFRTEEEAKRRAIDMCEKKLKSLAKLKAEVSKLLDRVRC
jgi:hypothetical protein